MDGQVYLQAEQHLFDTLKPILRRYAHLDLAELVDIALSKAWSILRAYGSADLFSYETIERKVRKWAAWWSTWHQRKRPYTKEQSETGRLKGLLTKQRRAAVKAYRCHILRQRGASMRWIAERLDISLGSVSGYLKRPWQELKKMFNSPSVRTPTRARYGRETKDTELNTNEKRRENLRPRWKASIGQSGPPIKEVDLST